MKSKDSVYKEKNEILRKLQTDKRKIKAESEALARKIQPAKSSKSVKQEAQVTN